MFKVFTKNMNATELGVLCWLWDQMIAMFDMKYGWACGDQEDCCKKCKLHRLCDAMHRTKKYLDKALVAKLAEEE